jgi:uncharacterized membrane protein YcaP (DUF421 family)
MDIVLRIAAIYLFLLIALRIMGKREFGQLAPFDLVVLLLIPEIVSQALMRDDHSVTNAFVAVATLLTLVFATGTIAYRFRRLERLISGTPTTLVGHGRLLPAALNRERVAPEEILDAMHRAGLEVMPQVKWAILEGDGKITVVPWQQAGGQRSAQDEDKGAQF